MAIIQDMKELPKNEPKLQKFSLFGLLICLGVSIFMLVWYFLRIGRSSSADSDPSWFWSAVHVGAYVAYAVVTGLGLYGAYYPKPQFISWYLIGSLAIIIAEVVCIIYNRIVITNENIHYSILSLLLKIVAIIVFITSAVLACLWKRFLDKRPSKQMEMADKTDQKVAAVKEAVKEPKNNGKAVESSKSDKTKSKA